MRSITARLLFAAMLAVASFAATTDAQNANVLVIHGINGKDVNGPESFPVDIAVNSQCALPNVKFRGVAGPIPFAPGTYKIDISVANTLNPCSNPAVISANVPFVAGEDAVVIAHLDANGLPTASKFSLDLSKPGYLKSRIILQHTAWAPNVDIRLKRAGFWFNRTVKLDNVPNGAQGSVDVLLGLWRLAIAPSGSTTPVIGPVYVPILPGLVYDAFVVGSVQNNTLTIIPLIRRANRT